MRKTLFAVMLICAASTILIVSGNKIEQIWTQNLISNGKTNYTVHSVLPFTPVESISLDKSSITLTEGDTSYLVATLKPSAIQNSSIKWISSDNSVIKIDDSGLITAQKEGTAIVEAVAENGRFATCSITVKRKIVVVSSSTTNKQKVADSSSINSNSKANSSSFQQITQIIYSNYGDQEGSLTIDNIGLKDEPVYHGDESEILEKAIGQFTGGHYPGEGGKIVLAGHNYKAFSKLEDINIGDIVSFKLKYGTFKYKVTNTKIFAETDSSLVATDDSKEYLVMYTCYPFNGGTYHPQRFAVFADLISAPTVTGALFK